MLRPLGEGSNVVTEGVCHGKLSAACHLGSGSVFGPAPRGRGRAVRILIVEDTEDFAEALARRLKKLGYAVDVAPTGTEADELLRLETYNLVVLDLTLPGLDGQAVLRRLRQRRDATPVLVLTARSAIDDRVGVLDLGADDYIVKPCDFRELEARCRALLRRPQGATSSTVRHGNLTFDTAARRVAVDDRPVELSSREFRLLELLLGNLDRVLGKDALIGQLFGFDEAVAPNAIELYVSRLRRKLEGSSVEIRTERGLGYVAGIHGQG
jgi:two-component system response regulator TctD